jgi:tetratricopeptide (TPR) repeat protein
MTSREGGNAAPSSKAAQDISNDSSNVSSAAAFCKAGHEHMQAGRHLDAQLCCQQALEADPNHIDALQLMGLLALQAQQYDHAIEWTARANQQDIKSDHLCSLGIALTQQGQHVAAFKAFDQALKLKPEDAELWAHLGNALASLALPEDALASYQRVLEFAPRHGDAAFRCGLLLLTLKRPEEALAYFNLSDEIYPNHHMVLEQRGLALYELKRFEEALADNRRAHELNPGSTYVCNNIGACLQPLRRDDEALPWFDKAIALQPDFVPALINKASSLTQMLRIDEAFATFQEAKRIDPDNGHVERNAALLHLLTGNFEAGWAVREVRWRADMHPATYPHFDQPMWRGEHDVQGKTILVHAEEGIGDTIQFARYAPMLAERGARVIFAVQEAVQPALVGLPGVSCIPKSIPSLPAFDLHCPVTTLPFAFRTRLDTIPSATSYLPQPPEVRVRLWEQRLQERLGPHRRLRVGLAWSGDPKHTNDHNRTMPSPTLLRLTEVNADFVSLQKDPRPEDKALLEQAGVVDLTDDLGDFAETAALISCLDVVITVDTGVAHLAGAFGRPTWLMLPYAPDFRWLLDREDSPWYPAMRLFRQTATRDWNELIDRVRTALAARIQSFRSQQG